MAMRIEDYATIGDCRTAALVGRDGSIDWLCAPRFDSGACFAALLGTPENGRWKLAPADGVEVKEVHRRYRPGSMVLETEFTTATSFLRTVPDPVLCESALLCYESGKAFTYDAFAVDQAIQTGHMPAQAVLDLIRSRHFKAVEIDFDANEVIRPAARGRFRIQFPSPATSPSGEAMH